MNKSTKSKRSCYMFILLFVFGAAFSAFGFFWGVIKGDVWCIICGIFCFLISLSKTMENAKDISVIAKGEILDFIHYTDWLKLTPDMAPPDGEPVFVTIKQGTDKFVLADVRYRNGKWEMFCDGTGGLGVSLKDRKSDGYWEELEPCEVTHWSPYPAPAEDL